MIRILFAVILATVVVTILIFMLTNNATRQYKSILYSSYDQENFDTNTKNKKCLYITTKGGLGNQIFQIASGYGLSKKYDLDFKILNYNNNNSHDSNSKYIQSIFKNFNFCTNEQVKDSCETIKEQSTMFSIHYIHLPHVENSFIIDGYLQNEKYFKPYKNELISIFKNNTIYTNIKNKYEAKFRNSFFIHVRMGDFKKVDLHNVILDKYYESVLSYIKQHLHAVDTTFYVFSDELVSSNSPDYLKQKNIFFIDENDPLTSLYMMSLCYKGGICANSSFSWWGSYLNENVDKFVSFPNKWLNSKDDVRIDIYYESAIVFAV